MHRATRLFFTALFCAVSLTTAHAALTVAHLRCDNATDPLGIDIAQPRLAWQVASDTPASPAERGQRQTAYQILVASTPAILAENRGDLWDSGRIASDATTLITYAGKKLSPSQQVFWKVRAWDRDNKPTAWSAPARWTMGLLAAADWGDAKWITAPSPAESIVLRRQTTLAPGKKIRRALISICGLGAYELAINGQKYGDDLLSPGWTNYNKTTLYDTHDVTALLRSGDNVIEIALGNSMYKVIRRNRFSKFIGDFGQLRAIARLRIEYTDGTTDYLNTDTSWVTNTSPITFNSIYGGEDHDARLRDHALQTGDLINAVVVTDDKTNASLSTLRGHTHATEPLRAIETHPPISVKTLSPQTRLYDFGQNASFMPRLRVTGPAGTTVRLTPGEVVTPDGLINRGTMGGAHRGAAWWQYTKATDAEETWFPQFYYVGSRYIYAELFPGVPPNEPTTRSWGGKQETPLATDNAHTPLPTITSLEAVIVHSTAEPIGDFSCSNDLLNRIRDLVRWAQRSNMVSVLTDCPHREKLGWIEQYHLNGPSIRYEYDTTRIYNKGMNDMAEAQTDDGLIPNITPEYTKFKGTFRAAAEWGAAFILVPWQHYLFTGDMAPMRTHYDAMKRYYAYLETRLDQDGFLAEGLGDWYDLLLPKLGRAGLTPAPITATAFLYEDARHLSKIATLLGHSNDSKLYSDKAAAIRARYNAKYYNADTGDYATRSQAANSLALVMDIAEPANRGRVLNALVRDVDEKGYATAGDVGFRYLLQALAQNGRSDVIYKMINQSEKPGYGYQLAQGCTALAESWYAGTGSSHNHFMLGQITEWFYKDLVGIDTDPAVPGFKNIIIRPNPVGDLTWAQATYDSPHGPIFVRWERSTPAHALKLQIKIPANTTATVWLPATATDINEILENGRPASAQPGIKYLRREVDRTIYQIEAGEYQFESPTR